MYWGVVSWLGVGPLVEIDGTLTGAQYAQILNGNIGHVKRNLNIASPYFIEDRVRLHTTNEVLNVKNRFALRDLNLPQTHQI